MFFSVRVRYLEFEVEIGIGLVFWGLGFGFVGGLGLGWDLGGGLGWGWGWGGGFGWGLLGLVFMVPFLVWLFFVISDNTILLWLERYQYTFKISLKYKKTAKSTNHPSLLI